MSALRWLLAAVVLLAVAAYATPRLWSASDADIGTSSVEAAEQFRSGTAHLRRLELDEARSELAAATETDPEFAMAHFELGHVLTWLGERSEGLAAILRADSLAQVPGQTTELERLVIGHTAAAIQDDVARREDHYEKLVREYPEDPRSLGVQAQRALEGGDPARAAELYRAVLTADPDRVEIHNTLGYLALQQGHYEEAVASFNRYVYFAPGSANPHDSLGEAYMWTGRYHESLEQYNAALEIDASFLSSVIGVTDALIVTGQFRLARRILDHFEELFAQRNRQMVREVKLLQVDYQAERWEKVVERSERLRADEAGFASADPGLRLWVKVLGTVSLAELGRIEEADALSLRVEESFTELLDQIDPENVQVRGDLQLLRASMLCRMALIEGKAAARELASLRGLIEASTHQPHRLLPFQKVLIQSLYEAGLDAEVLEIAPAILAFNPNHPRTLFVSAQAEARLRNREAAVDYLARYLDVMRDADSTHPRVNRARQLYDRLAPSS